MNCLTPRAHVLAKIAQFNFLPQGGHFNIIKMGCLLFQYVILILTNFNLPHFILISMIVPCELLSFPCLLTKVFTHYGIEIGTEISSLGKENFESTSINRIFLLRNDFNKIMNGETIVKKEAKVKKTHHEKIPRGKRKKVDKEEDESVEVLSGSEGEPNGKASKQGYTRLKKEVTSLKESFRKLKKSVKNDLSEIKNNLKWLFKKLGLLHPTGFLF